MSTQGIVCMWSRSELADEPTAEMTCQNMDIVANYSDNTLWYAQNHCLVCLMSCPGLGASVFREEAGYDHFTPWATIVSSDYIVNICSDRGREKIAWWQKQLSGDFPYASEMQCLLSLPVLSFIIFPMVIDHFHNNQLSSSISSTQDVIHVLACLHAVLTT